MLGWPKTADVPPTLTFEAELITIESKKVSGWGEVEMAGGG